MSIRQEWINKIVVQSHSEMLLNNKNEENSETQKKVQTNLENTILSEKSQTEKNVHSMVTCIRISGTCKPNFWLKKIRIIFTSFILIQQGVPCMK